MKKRIIYVIICCIFILTGCTPSNATRNKIKLSLEKNKIIEKNMEFVDRMIYANSGVIPVHKEYDVYKKSNGSLVVIYYDKVNSDDYDYVVKIYNNVTIDDTVEKVEPTVTETYSYSNSSETTNNSKYVLDECDTYYVVVKKFLIFKRYEIKKDIN